MSKRALIQAAMAGDDEIDCTDIEPVVVDTPLYEETEEEKAIPIDLDGPIPEDIAAQLMDINGQYLYTDLEIHAKLTTYKNQEINLDDIGTKVEERFIARGEAIEAELSSNYRQYKKQFGIICRRPVTDREIVDTMDKILYAMHTAEIKWNRFLDEVCDAWRTYKEDHARCGYFLTRKDQEDFFTEATLFAGYEYMLRSPTVDSGTSTAKPVYNQKLLPFLGMHVYTWWDDNGWLVISRYPKPAPVIIQQTVNSRPIILKTLLASDGTSKLVTDGPAVVIPAPLAKKSLWNQRLVMPVTAPVVVPDATENSITVRPPIVDVVA
jgi:hypothetical protein